MNFNPQSEQEESLIELTPLIDVVFLLLIFFMISTTFTKETALKIRLPEAESGVVQQEPLTVEVQIGQQSQYAILSNQQAGANTLINSNRATLVRALSEYKTQEDVLLIIRADRLATHESVIKVLDVAQELDLTNITFAAEQSQE